MGTASPIARRPAARRLVAHFVIAALRLLADDVAAGAEVPFALGMRGPTNGSALYEYRPLFQAYIEARLQRLCQLADYQGVIETLTHDPSLLGAARDHARDAPDDEAALRDAILLPILVGVAEGVGHFEWSDPVFDGIFDRMCNDVTARRRSFTAFAPLTGIKAADAVIDLGRAVSARRFGAADLADAWPECQGLLPDGFAVRPDRLIGLELELTAARSAPWQEPDAARRFAHAVTALRLVFGGPIATGPCLFERVDWSPRAVRALPASIALAPTAEPVHLDPQRASLVRALVDRIDEAELRGGAVTVALSAWAQTRALPVAAERAAGMVGALRPLLDAEDGAGYAAAMRAAVLVGSTASERERVAAALRAAQRLALPNAPRLDADQIASVIDETLRFVLVVALDHGDDPAVLAETLDAVLLGARPRPQVVSRLAKTA